MTTNTKNRTLLGAAKLLFSTTAIVGIALSSSAAFAVLTPIGTGPTHDVTMGPSDVGGGGIPVRDVVGPAPAHDVTMEPSDVGGGPSHDPAIPEPPTGGIAGIDQSDVFEAFATFAAGGNGLRVIYTTIGNSQNLASISPAAGGTSAEALAGIAPAAGGDDNAVERTETSSSDSCWAEGASRSAGAFGANITTNFDQCE